jgi:hypothetical protein
LSVGCMFRPLSAISAGTDQESVCQLTQNWHNGSQFFRPFKQCSRRPFRFVRQGPLRIAVYERSIRLGSLRVLDRDPEAPWSLTIAPERHQFPAPIMHDDDEGLRSKRRDLWLCPVWDPAGVDA